MYNKNNQEHDEEFKKVFGLALEFSYDLKQLTNDPQMIKGILEIIKKAVLSE